MIRYVYRFENQRKNRNADGRGKYRLSKSSSDDSGSSISNGEEQDNGSPQEMPAMLWYMPDYSQKRGCPIPIDNAEGDFEASHSLSSSSTGPQEPTVLALAAPIINMTQQHIDHQNTMRRLNKAEATQISGSAYHRHHNQSQSQEYNIIDNMVIDGVLYEQDGLTDVTNRQENMEYPKDSIKGLSALDIFQDCPRFHPDVFDDWMTDVTDLPEHCAIKPRSQEGTPSRQLDTPRQ